MAEPQNLFNEEGQVTGSPPVERMVELGDAAKTEVVLDPVMGVSAKSTTLAPAAAEDIQAQQTGSSWEDVLAGKVEQVGDSLNGGKCYDSSPRFAEDPTASLNGP